jgi:adenosylcobinamide-GDP ribazoletransferase
VSARVKEAQLAFMILTRLPVGRIAGDAPPLFASVWAFPLVGLTLGLGMGLIFALATALNLPALAAALLALAAGALATGGLHEDGLADTADGFGGAQTVTRKLEIMRDSRIGSYGVLALIFVVGLTASAMAGHGSIFAFLAIGALSRSAMLLPMSLLKPAREDGLGHVARTALDSPVWVALGISVLVAIAAGVILPALLMFGAALTVTVLARRQIGGQTGDVLGATQKIAECVGWLGVAALA